MVVSARQQAVAAVASGACPPTAVVEAPVACVARPVAASRLAKADGNRIAAACHRRAADCVALLATDRVADSDAQFT
jgi:hypothetical protein